MKMTFGKHRGKDVEVVRADTQYAAWLMTQPWFPETYPKVYVALTGESISVGDTCFHPPKPRHRDAEHQQTTPQHGCIILGFPRSRIVRHGKPSEAS
jgi:hypothetical protein